MPPFPSRAWGAWDHASDPAAGGAAVQTFAGSYAVRFEPAAGRLTGTLRAVRSNVRHTTPASFGRFPERLKSTTPTTRPTSATAGVRSSWSRVFVQPGGGAQECDFILKVNYSRCFPGCRLIPSSTLWYPLLLLHSLPRWTAVSEHGSDQPF